MSSCGRENLRGSGRPQLRWRTQSRDSFSRAAPASSPSSDFLDRSRADSRAAAAPPSAGRQGDRSSRDSSTETRRHDPYLAFGVAHQHDGFASDEGAEIVAGLFDLALVADINPRRAEDPLQLELEDRRIAIELPMNAGGLHKRSKILRGQHASLRGCGAKIAEITPIATSLCAARQTRRLSRSPQL